MMHKSVAGEFQKEVDNTTVLLDDILSILALLEAGDWSEHCTKTELGGRLEREITRLIGDAQEATVTSYELIAEAWRLMDGQDPKTSDWHSKASKYLNSNIVEKVDDDRIEAVKAVLRRLAGNSPVTPDGWVMVPKQVTPEISNAINVVGQRCTCGNCSQRLWDLLLDATQQGVNRG